MGWLGKIVGSTIGFALGGPLGAVAGATFGHAFDLSDEQYLSEDGKKLSLEENSQLTFFVAVFSMLAKLVQADGQVSKEELRSIEQFMANDLNLNRESQHVASNIFNTAIKSPESFQSFASQFYNQFQNQPQMLDLMIDILLRVSVADRVLSPSEEQLILSAVKIFHFDPSAYGKIKSRYIEDNEKYYSILGCSRTDSDETIKKQYRKFALDYHPDRIASKGLPEEFTTFAQDKFREIQEAYDMVKKERGL